MQTYLVQLRGEDEDDGDDRFAPAGRRYFLSSAPSSTFFFFSVLDPSSLSLLPAAFSFSLLCFLEKKQRNEILFFLPLVSPGSVVPPLFLCPVFSVQDEENGDRMRYCWLMYQNFSLVLSLFVFPRFCLLSSGFSIMPSLLVLSFSSIFSVFAFGSWLFF